MSELVKYKRNHVNKKKMDNDQLFHNHRKINVGTKQLTKWNSKKNANPQLMKTWHNLSNPGTTLQTHTLQQRIKFQKPN